MKDTSFISVGCFGVAWDLKANECSVCDVSQRCRRLTLELERKKNNGNMTSEQLAQRLEEIQEEKSHRIVTMKHNQEVKNKLNELIPKYEKKIREDQFTKVNKSNKAKVYKPDMPNFKEMTLEELKDLAVSKGIHYTAKDNRILRMRLIVLLKKKYEL